MEHEARPVLPLEQRKSGRAQRRAARMEGDDNEETAANMGESSESRSKRGPSDEVERRIAAAIEKRTRSNKCAAIINDVDYDEKNEILGTYEYLDHTADIQLHSWGNTLAEALSQLAMAMFGYMTKLSLVEINELDSKELASNVTAKAHDLMSLVFAFLQEWLCIFHETGFVARAVDIHELDLENFVVKSIARGEKMQVDRHFQGTEIKAVTYSNLQVVQDDEHDRWDIWVIVDI